MPIIIKGSGGAQKTPTISVSSSGLITATAGKKSATKQLSTQAAQTITPGTGNQYISSGKYLTGKQTIKGDANLNSDNIKYGVKIFGITGNVVDQAYVWTTASGADSSFIGIPLDIKLSNVSAIRMVADSREYSEKTVLEVFLVSSDEYSAPQGYVILASGECSYTFAYLNTSSSGTTTINIEVEDPYVDNSRIRFSADSYDVTIFGTTAITD